MGGRAEESGKRASREGEIGEGIRGGGGWESESEVGRIRQKHRHLFDTTNH